jgi:hypothetical protein
MSLVDKFDDHVEPSFTRSYDPESARRQLRVSVVLVGAMLVAAFVLGSAVPYGANNSTKTTIAASDAASFGRLVSIDR